MKKAGQCSVKIDSFEGFAVIPTNGSNKPSDVRDSLKASILALSRLKSIAPNPAAQDKVFPL